MITAKGNSSCRRPRRQMLHMMQRELHRRVIVTVNDRGRLAKPKTLRNLWARVRMARMGTTLICSEEGLLCCEFAVPLYIFYHHFFEEGSKEEPPPNFMPNS